MVAHAPSAGQVIKEFSQWLPPDAILLAHNARYDCNILAYECDRFDIAQPNWPIVDTLTWAKKVRPQASCRLQMLKEHYNIKLTEAAHRALPDAQVTQQVFLKIQEELGNNRCTPTDAHLFSGLWRYPRTGPPGFELLAQACREQRQLTFSYTDARGASTQRTALPWSYARTERGIRFHGLCSLRQERRHFAFERCQQIALA